jgi:hypothetical protein
VESSVDRKKVWVLVICAGPRLGLVRVLRAEHTKTENSYLWYLPVFSDDFDLDHSS